MRFDRLRDQLRDLQSREPLPTIHAGRLAGPDGVQKILQFSSELILWHNRQLGLLDVLTENRPLQLLDIRLRHA